MKGIVFTEFLEMVENEFGLEVLDSIIENSELPSEGVYTSVGTYDFMEMQNLIVNLSKETGLEVDALLHAYGRYFFDVLTSHHQDIFDLYSSPLDMLASIENHIHVHVRKIYPGAELPTFQIIDLQKNYLEMIYYSDRSMYMFAKGLMERTFEHYHSGYQIDLEKLAPDGSKVRFKIVTQ
ncbi:hypothetical protein E7Z59_08050 [Robertkochia marina]|uniref:Heme NO-binding domain-containing protein n=1 Tax=Robertkochia marina TaxID=1227945 RepID=A0A4S3LZR8_9FLAO|nr:heme NO-binding domain-containing protein [Robertkochia marina]THD67604.1 hypothetical protein E7Z59_08050 [Robertkochia marina]TRZ44527.1 hypothetical protein D3A96_07895 [Robertkochia marina]